MMMISFYMSSLLMSMLGCLLSKNWLMMWFWMELQSLTLIPILSSKISPRSMESTKKYFLFQATGSALLLLGILTRLFFSGTMSIEGKYKWMEYFIIMMSLCIKSGMFPIHFWFIDVMQGMNYQKGFFVAIPSKMIPIYIIMLISKTPSKTLLSIIGVLSMITGSMFGVQQMQLRKLMALSSMTHLGWMMVAFPKTSNWFGFLLFISYIMMVLPLFWVGNIYKLEHLSKANKISKKTILASILLMSMLSMAGFPPLLGFFYKWILFFIVLNNKSSMIMMILISASLLSLYFYMQICISVYMMKWPLSKTLFKKSYFSIKINVMQPWIMILSNTILMYSLCMMLPLTSKWKM